MKQLIFLVLFLPIIGIIAQEKTSRELSGGIVLQKTQNLYIENGVGLDYTCDRLLKKKIHIKGTYLSSRLGSAVGSNAIKQDYFILGADYRFFSDKPLQLLAGLNTGLFTADYEDAIFDDLPSTSLLLAIETGLNYKFKQIPLSASLTIGYNVRNGNGVDIPGSLFPVFYKVGFMYRFDNLFNK
jgi:hypothetical protein